MVSLIRITHRRQLRDFLLLWLLLGAPSQILAAEPVSFCFNDWPPYAEMTATGPAGISIAIIQRAAENLGREVVFSEMGWSDCLQQVRDGNIDAVLDAAAREEYLQGPTSFSSYTDTFWVSNNSDISRYDQLSGGKIAVVEGYKYDPRLMAHIENLNLEIEYGLDDPSNIKNLTQGNISAAIADLASTFALVRDQRIQAHPILPPFSVEKLYVSFHSGNSGLQSEFDAAFAELIKRGYVDAVYEQWIGTPYSSFASPQ